MTTIAIDDAGALAARALAALGLRDDEIAHTVPHLLDCELRGLEYSGLARILSIRDRLEVSPFAGERAVVTERTSVSARIDGGDRLGYTVAQLAVGTAIELATSGPGVAVVGANRTWYTGILSYFGEQLAAAGLVGMLASSAAAWVAPFGSTEARMGTNPIAFAFPGVDRPFVWDIGIAEIIHAQVVIAQRTGADLPTGVAYDADGEPTIDPVAALGGAFVNWGGHRGSGLGLVVQLLGALAGAPVLPDGMRDFGFLVLAIDPALLGDADAFRSTVEQYMASIESARPVDPDRPVRVPFARSAALRAERVAAGSIDVPEAILREVVAIADEPPRGRTRP